MENSDNYQKHTNSVPQMKAAKKYVLVPYEKAKDMH